MWFRRKSKADPAETIRGLRQHALTVSAADLGLGPTADRPQVWGVVMETGYPEAVATLVVLGEGTTSLYFSNGGHPSHARSLPSKSPLLKGRFIDEALSRVHTPDLGAGIRLPAVRRSISGATDMGRLGIRVQVETHDCGLAARPRLVQVPAQPKTSRGTWRHRHRTVRVWHCLYRSIQRRLLEHQSVHGSGVRSRTVCRGVFVAGAGRCLPGGRSWPTRVPTTEFASALRRRLQPSRRGEHEEVGFGREPVGV